MPVVQIDVDAAEAELAADALWQADPTGVSEIALGAGRVRLTADVAAPDRIAARWGAEVVEPDTEAHLDAWRAWARPKRIGRVVLQPAWLAAEAVDPGDVVVRLDPGRSFGSGSHASTRLAVAALERLIRGGERVLDVGCGSGVLGVVACRLGAASAMGVDVDDEALAVTRANAVANGVADQVEVHGDLPAVDGPFDVVVANIGVRILLDLAAALPKLLAPGGWLVLSGLLEGQGDEVVAAHPGLTEVQRLAEDGWVAPLLRAGR